MTAPDHTTAPGTMLRKPLDTEVDVFGLTHLGNVRAVNQDHFMISSLRKQMEVHITSLPTVDQLPLEGERLAYLAMLADGVGGGTGGEAASRLAIETISRYIAHSMRCYYTADAKDEAFLDALQEAALECHASVVREAEEAGDRHHMATTLTLWLGVWPRSYLLQVGDSRFYLFRNDELSQITRDQTMAQELIDQGVLARSDAGNSQLAHVLSSSIGGSQTAPVVTRVDQAWHNVGLLCSDGLTKHVSDAQICERLRTMRSARQACRALVQDALDGGGSDNITVIVGRLVRQDLARADNPSRSGEQA